MSPSTIYCVHANYHSRIDELGRTPPLAPGYFLKPVASYAAGGGDVFTPPGCRYLCFEGEIAIVIGETVRNASIDQARSAIAGYAPANDLGLHDFVEVDAGSLLRDKGHDGFCPVGQMLAAADVGDTPIDLRTLVDGEVVQSASSDEMLFGFDYVVADLARFVSLTPGDLILTGTPSGSRPLQPGQAVTVELNGYAAVTSTVVAGPPVKFTGGAQPSDSAKARLLALADRL